LSNPVYDTDPAEMIGKLVLVGIRFYDQAKALIDVYETHGIAESYRNGLLAIRRDDSSLFHVPISPILIAQPGTYHERSSGKDFVNPGFLCQWKIEDVTDPKTISDVRARGLLGWNETSEL